MSLILNLDSAVETASVCLADKGMVVENVVNPYKNDHAAWMHVAIRDLTQRHHLQLSQIDAIAITLGPGSYTGLRVSMATAKGLCYALKIPLITLNTLKVMAFSARHMDSCLLCPMIDARRMEVFTAVFDAELKEVEPSSNIILSADSFSELMNRERVCFFGNGSHKFYQLTKHPNAIFTTANTTAEHMVSLSYEQFSVRIFTDLVYSEPFYGKDFYSTFK